MADVDVNRLRRLSKEARDKRKSKKRPRPKKNKVDPGLLALRRRARHFIAKLPELLEKEAREGKKGAEIFSETEVSHRTWPPEREEDCPVNKDYKEYLNYLQKRLYLYCKKQGLNVIIHHRHGHNDEGIYCYISMSVEW